MTRTTTMNTAKSLLVLAIAAAAVTACEAGDELADETSLTQLALQPDAPHGAWRVEVAVRAGQLVEADRADGVRLDTTLMLPIDITWNGPAPDEQFVPTSHQVDAPALSASAFPNAADPKSLAAATTPLKHLDLPSPTAHGSRWDRGAFVDGELLAPPATTAMVTLSMADEETGEVVATADVVLVAGQATQAFLEAQLSVPCNLDRCGGRYVIDADWDQPEVGEVTMVASVAAAVDAHAFAKLGDLVIHEL